MRESKVDKPVNIRGKLGRVGDELRRDDDMRGRANSEAAKRDADASFKVFEKELKKARKL